MQEWDVVGRNEILYHYLPSVLIPIVTAYAPLEWVPKRRVPICGILVVSIIDDDVYTIRDSKLYCNEELLFIKESRPHAVEKINDRLILITFRDHSIVYDKLVKEIRHTLSHIYFVYDGNLYFVDNGNELWMYDIELRSYHQVLSEPIKDIRQMGSYLLLQLFDNKIRFLHTDKYMYECYKLYLWENDCYIIDKHTIVKERTCETLTFNGFLYGAVGYKHLLYVNADDDSYIVHLQTMSVTKCPYRSEKNNCFYWSGDDELILF